MMHRNKTKKTSRTERKEEQSSCCESPYAERPSTKAIRKDVEGKWWYK